MFVLRLIVMSSPEFKFLKDRPLETLEELSGLKFGHEEITRTLSKIIKNCPAPFTIGLFAKWGSGKSTIANSLKEQLPQNNIPVVIFDVWKHEGDALRRTFLKETVRQLKEYGSKYFDKHFKLDDRLERSEIHSSEFKFKFEWRKLKPVRRYGLILLALLILVGVIAVQSGNFEILISVTTSIAVLIVSAPLFYKFLEPLVPFLPARTTSYGVDRFQDPHEFEEVFASVLKGLRNTRILVIFDNLDRVTPEKVAEILSTIKTFLEPRDVANSKKEVIFLIPCDALAIKQHLSHTYESSERYTFDSDEFLRKVFNSILWIPDFIPTELESFSRSVLQRTIVESLNNDHVAWLITKAFRNNPRQIIQFVNILLANYLLIQEREGENKDFPPGFLNRNIPQMTKYILLNQLFPDEMETLREKKTFSLDDITEIRLTLESNDTKGKTHREFLEFLNETLIIPMSNLRIFSTLRLSEQEKKFPGFDSFVTFLEDQKLDDAKEYFSQFGDFSDPEIIDNFSQAIKTELAAKTNPVSLVNLINSLLKILSEYAIDLKGTVYSEINNALKNKCGDEIHVISPALINQALLLQYDAYRPAIIRLWIGTVEKFVGGTNTHITHEQICDIVRFFTEHPGYLNTAQKDQVKDLLSGHLSHDVSIGEVVTASLEIQNEFVTDNYVVNFINKMSTDGEADEMLQKLAVLTSLEEPWFKAVDPEVLLQNLSALFARVNQMLPPNERENLINSFRRTIRKLRNLFHSAPDSVKDRLIHMFLDADNALSPAGSKDILIPILVEVRRIAPAHLVEKIDETVFLFLSNVTPENLHVVLEKLSVEDKTEFFGLLFYIQGENRALDDEVFRSAFYRYLPETRKIEFVQKLFAHNISTALQFIEFLERGEDEIVSSVFNIFWTNFSAFSPDDKKRILSLVVGGRAGADSVVLEKFAETIINMLCAADLTLQEIGLQAFTEGKELLSGTHERRIAKEVFDWLSRLELTNKYQPSAIRAVFSEYGQFNDEEKGSFQQFLFDELIRKGTDIQQIGLGFELLRKIEPSYKVRKGNFDDIRTRAEGEAVPEIKQILIDGLNSLKPNDRTNARFWKEVGALR